MVNVSNHVCPVYACMKSRDMYFDVSKNSDHQTQTKQHNDKATLLAQSNHFSNKKLAIPSALIFLLQITAHMYNILHTQ